MEDEDEEDILLDDEEQNKIYKSQKLETAVCGG